MLMQPSRGQALLWHHRAGGAGGLANAAWLQLAVKTGCGGAPFLLCSLLTCAQKEKPQCRTGDVQPHCGRSPITGGARVWLLAGKEQGRRCWHLAPAQLS